MNILKKSRLMTCAIVLLVPSLVACNSNAKNEKSDAETTKSSEVRKADKPSEEGFLNSVSNYFYAQQELMELQNNTVSQEFEDLSQHAKEVVDSGEYETWLNESEILESYDVGGLENSDNYKLLQRTISDYNEIQVNFFEGVAEAKTKEEYNDVITKIEEELINSQDALSDVYNDVLN